jgi:hypothetical protein
MLPELLARVFEAIRTLHDRRCASASSAPPGVVRLGDVIFRYR